MQGKGIGESLLNEFPGEVGAEAARKTGVSWRLDEETIKKIEAIESNIRAAEQQSGMILLR